MLFKKQSPFAPQRVIFMDMRSLNRNKEGITFPFVTWGEVDQHRYWTRLQFCTIGSTQTPSLEQTSPPPPPPTLLPSPMTPSRSFAPRPPAQSSGLSTPALFSMLPFAASKVTKTQVYDLKKHIKYARNAGSMRNLHQIL